MPDPVHLHGYRYSVYTRTARLALLLKQVEHGTIEVDPFADLAESYLNLHPFGRVPTLTHGAFTVFETGAITRYIDRAFPGPPLQPESARALARMDQLISALDAYGYWPLVRQVASHAFFRPRFGEPGDRDEIDAGLKASAKILAFLDKVAAEALILTGRDLTLADCHLAPMIDYFVRCEEGRTALAAHPALQRWWDQLSADELMTATDPLPDHPVPTAGLGTGGAQ